MGYNYPCCALAVVWLSNKSCCGCFSFWWYVYLLHYDSDVLIVEFVTVHRVSRNLMWGVVAVMMFSLTPRNTVIVGVVSRLQRINWCFSVAEST